MSFKKSTKNGYRYQVGSSKVSTETLWGLSRPQKELLADNLELEMEKAAKPGRFSIQPLNMEELTVKYAVICAVIEEDKKDDVRANEALEDKKYDQELDDAILKAEKKDLESKFAGKTPAELRAMRKKKK